jgi:nitrate reductase gamma subunit
MRDLTNSILFGWYPYLVLTIFLLGTWLRFDRESMVWSSVANELRCNSQLRWGASVFLAGIAALLAGHLVGLLTPISLFEAIGISHGLKQQMAIGIGGIAGMLGFIGIGLLLHRMLFDARIRAALSLGEAAILLMVFAQLSLGLGTILASLKFIDGCAMVKFMSWAQGILTLKPGVSALIAGVPPIFKLHIVLGMTILLVFPFTRAVGILGVPLRYFRQPRMQPAA